MSSLNTTLQSSPGRSIQVATPSSVLANQSPNMPAPECCCFSARFVNLVLYLFNFIFLLSGICILLMTLLYGRPEVSKYLGETTKHLNIIIDLLGNGHLVQIIHYSMLICGIIIIIISLINICFSTATSWSKSSDYYYYHRKHRQQCLNENEALLYDGNGVSSRNLQRHRQSGSIMDSTIDHNEQSSSSCLNDDSFMNQCRNSSENESKHASTPSSSSLVSNASTVKNHRTPTPNRHHHTIGYRYDSPIQTSSLEHKLERKQQLERHRSSLSHFSNSTIVLCFYIFILLFLFTVQLVIGLLAIITVSPDHVFVSTHTAEDDDFLVSIRESVDIPNLLVNRGEDIEKLYGVFHCCGWVYFDDYEYLADPNMRNKTIPVPDACCKTYVKNCGHRKHPNNIYYDGCWSKFGAEMRDYVLMLGWTALGFAVIELIGLMFAVCHYVQIVSKF